MILYEYEGKEIFKNAGVEVPRSQVISYPKDKIKIKAPVFVKAQVLSGKRKKAGGIIFAKDGKALSLAVNDLLGKKINDEKVGTLLLEKPIEHKREYYLSISYDTTQRSPIVTFSKSGGTGIEGRRSKTVVIDILNPGKIKIVMPKEVGAILPKLVKLFLNQDMLLLEINPLVIEKNKAYALDAKIKLDDEAKTRHPEWKFKKRQIPGHKPTQREIAAKKIDQDDYRGTAGSAYFDLPGEIAILASGGGASLTAMDSLLSAGGKPANYTEYSGNPPKEKVEKLTKIVLSKKGLKGLWIVGAVANFTDIYQTLSGFLEALRKIKPKPTYPIVIRRGGPNDKQAFTMLQKIKDFDFHLYGQEISITESAKIMADLSKKHVATKK